MRRGLILLLAFGFAWTLQAEDAGMQKALEAFAKGKLEESREAFAKLAETNPDDVLIHLNLGTVLFRMKQLPEAAKALQRAVEIDRENKAAWLTLGIVQLEQGQDDDALAALSRAVQLDPRNARAHAYLGVAIGQRGWLLGAEQELRRALELEPNYAEAHFNLALFYLRRTPAAIELARRHYERALALGSAPDPLVEEQLKAAALPSPSPSP